MGRGETSGGCTSGGGYGSGCDGDQDVQTCSAQIGGGHTYITSTTGHVHRPTSVYPPITITREVEVPIEVEPKAAPAPDLNIRNVREVIIPHVYQFQVDGEDDNYCHLDYLQDCVLEAKVEERLDEAFTTNIRNPQIIEAELQREQLRVLVEECERVESFHQKIDQTVGANINFEPSIEPSREVGRKRRRTTPLVDHPLSSWARAISKEGRGRHLLSNHRSLK